MSEEATMQPVNVDAGQSLRDAMNGVTSPSVTSNTERESWEQETSASSTTDLDQLGYDNDNAGEAEQLNATEPAPVEDNSPELELKVKGYKDLQKIKLNPNDDNLKQLLNKGMRFEKAMQETAAQRKELQDKLERYQDYEAKAEIADRVQSAKSLLEQGFSEQALTAILGEGSESFIESLVEERIKYQTASPEERLQIDLNRQKRGDQLERQKDADRIAKLEAQINSRSEQVREAEFSGYIEDAKGRYDLSQWIDDADVSESLNDMLHTAAMSDIIKLQRQREAKGETNISQRDIRRAYAERAKKLVSHQERQSSLKADQKVSQQSEVAKQNAQVASTKNYGKTDIMSEWQKSGGRMSDLVDLFNRGKGRIL